MIYVILIVLIFVVEYGLKNHVEKTGDAGTNKPILKGMFLMTKFHNQGAFRGFGREKKKMIKFVSVGLSVILTIVFICSLTQHGNTALKTGLSFLLGGAYSNTYDRLKKNYVVDYFRFNVKWKPLRNMIFNISDFCILIGALIIALRN